MLQSEVGVRNATKRYHQSTKGKECAFENNELLPFNFFDHSYGGFTFIGGWNLKARSHAL